MAWLPILGALLTAAITLVTVGLMVRRRRARRRLAEAQRSGEEGLLVEREVEREVEPVRALEPLMDDHDLDEAHAIPLTVARSEPSVHDKKTRAMRAAPDDDAPPSLHETPTREFSAYQDPHDEITAQGPGDLASVANNPFADFGSDDGERTCVYQPDAEVLDTLRGLAASTSPVRTAEPSKAPEPAKAQASVPVPALSFGLPPPPRQMAERVRSLPPLDRAPSESFYIQSNVRSEERVLARRLSSRAPAPANDVRTSGFAPTSASHTSARSADAQARRARNGAKQ